MQILCIFDATSIVLLKIDSMEGFPRRPPDPHSTPHVGSAGAFPFSALTPLLSNTNAGMQKKSSLIVYVEK
jgi:hypothetical protein